MRKVLLRFVFDDYWQFQPLGNELLVGAGWLVLFWLAVSLITGLVTWKQTRDMRQVASSGMFWLVIPAFVMMIPLLQLPLAQTGVPIFGYGVMLFVGFTSATVLAARRIVRIGLSPDVIWDLMLWVLIPGLLGARINFLLAEGRGLLATKQGLLEKLKTFVALWDGGIVFYGCVIGGTLGLLAFCRRRGIHPVPLCDVIAPSLFIGEGFGRIGCFLYGCCFGRACSLPWAVQFPSDSLTFEVLSKRHPPGVEGLKTIPLHPTQIYSALSAFLLAGLLSWYFRRRPWDGAVLGLAWILYPINRFVLETFREDTARLEMLGLRLPLGQWVSLGLLASGIPAMWLFARQNRLTTADSRASAGAAPRLNGAAGREDRQVG